ncbi:MAG TPA: GGDEF domain-containing protein, partial [Planctomycetes bacterium]|nr:GGDEF domain-containing protein [Planctomycetota bacterium]
AYWAAGLVWLLPFTFMYREGEQEKEAREKRKLQREKLKEETEAVGRAIKEMEARLANSRRWRDRMAPLCNLAEDLLAALRPGDVASALVGNLPQLIPSADRFYCYRLDGVDTTGRVQMAAALPPEEGASGVYVLDELDRTCIQEGRAVISEDVRRTSVKVHPERLTGSVVIAPLTMRMKSGTTIGGVRQTVGALRVEAMQPAAFDRSDFDILSVMGDAAAGAFLNTDLYIAREQLAVRDALTGLLLRHVFFERAAQDMSRSRRSGASFSVVMLDIDDFKRLNDTWGHTAGDLVLKKLAAILLEALQPGEIVCRYGGEELTALLHNDVLRAERRVRRLIARFAEEKFLFPDEKGEMREVHATVSAGIAAFPLHGDDLVGLIQQADRALYRAKRLGKNQPVTARKR